MERKLDSRTIYSGRLLTVRSDTVEISGNRKSSREVVEHRGAVGIVPVTSTGSILLVRHYRYAVDRILLEIPAGTRETQEAVELTAARELAEETGYEARKLEEVARFFTSPGWSTEEIVLFRAEGLIRASPGFDRDEILDVVEVQPERISVLMRDGLIADAKTIIGLKLALPHYS